MGFVTKLWKDRQSEFPNRRTLTKEDQSTELVTVTRSEGIISEEGDAFSAENMNDLETRIKNAIGTGSIPGDLGADIIAAINALNTNLNGMRIIQYSNATAVNGYASSSALVSDIRFAAPLDDTNYIVLPVLQTTKDIGVNVSIGSKTVSGFRIRIDAVPGTFAQGDNLNVSWIAFKY